jgi:2'-5' RNA ligase
MAHSGVIIAIYPDPRNLVRLVPVARALPDSTPVDEMHVTICYLGEKEALEPKKAVILAALMLVTQAPPVLTPLALRVRGLQRMEGDDGGKNALAARIASPELHRLRASIVDMLLSLNIRPDQDWPVYQPHLTLGYIDTYLPTPDVRVPMLTIPAGSICLCWGDERIVLPLAPQRYPDQSQFAGYTMEDWDHDEPVKPPSDRAIAREREHMRRALSPDEFRGAEALGLVPPVRTKTVSGPMAQPAHGTGGLFSNPALEGGRRRRRFGSRIKTEIEEIPAPPVRLKTRNELGDTKLKDIRLWYLVRIE